MNLRNLIATTIRESLIENLIIEDFKSIKVKYLSQGIDSDIINKYISDFKSIKDLKEFNDDIEGFPIPKGNDRKNIDKYTDFHTLETIVDYVKGRRDISKATFDNNSSEDENLLFPGNVVLKDNEVEIKYADSPRACIEYKGKFPYSWCISRTDASNMFSTYRFKEHEPAFYFVKRIKATEKEFGIWNMTKNVFNGSFKDKYHFFVVQVVKNANVTKQDQKQYVVTSAANDGDVQMTWNDILKFAPDLSGKQELFKPIPLTSNEKEIFDRYIKGISDDEFSKLDYKEKRNYLDIYVKMDKILTDNQFTSLPDDLKGLYIAFGVPISNNIFDFIMTNNKLKKRYDDILKKRIEEFLKGTTKIGFGGKEFRYALDNNLVPLDQLNIGMVKALLAYIPEEYRFDLAKQIIPIIKDKLDFEMVENLITNMPLEYKFDLVKQIFPLVKDKLDKLGEGMINALLAYIPLEYRFDLAKEIILLTKDKLDAEMVYDLLNHTQYSFDLAKQIILLAKDKLDVYVVNNLLWGMTEEQRFDLIKQIFPLFKNKLDADIISTLLHYTPKEYIFDLVKQIIPIIKDKLDADMVENLLDYTPREHKEYIQGLINNARGINENAMLYKNKELRKFIRTTLCERFNLYR